MLKKREQMNNMLNNKLKHMLNQEIIQKKHDEKNMKTVLKQHEKLPPKKKTLSTIPTHPINSARSELFWETCHKTESLH